MAEIDEIQNKTKNILITIFLTLTTFQGSQLFDLVSGNLNSTRFYEFSKTDNCLSTHKASKHGSHESNFRSYKRMNAKT